MLNFTHLIINRKNSKIVNIIFTQSIGLLFDLIPSVRESFLYDYIQKYFGLTISDGWVGLGGASASVFEILAIIEGFNIPKFEILVNSS